MGVTIQQQQYQHKIRHLHIEVATKQQELKSVTKKTPKIYFL